MQELIINTIFDGSEISLVSVEQAMFLNKENNIAVQIKNYSDMIDFTTENPVLNKIINCNVIDNAINFYGIHNIENFNFINPKTHNILLLTKVNNNININRLNIFDEIWAADETILEKTNIKNASIFQPNLFLYEDNNLFNKTENNILCSFSSDNLDKFVVFLDAYLQTEQFEKSKLIIISDLLINNLSYEFIKNIILEEKSKYNISKNLYKINLLYSQTPLNINSCIINSDLFILLDYDGWSLLASHFAELSKSIIIPHYSCMSKYIYNCDIIMDLSINYNIRNNNYLQYIYEIKNLNSNNINIWKLFLKDYKICNKTYLLNKNIKFSDLCKRR